MCAHTYAYVWVRQKERFPFSDIVCVYPPGTFLPEWDSVLEKCIMIDRDLVSWWINDCSAPIPNRSGLSLGSEEIWLHTHLTVFSMYPVSTWTRSSIVFLCKPSALFQPPENQRNPTFKESLVKIFLVKCFISVSVVSTSSWTLQRRTFIFLETDILYCYLLLLQLGCWHPIRGSTQSTGPNASGPKTKTPNAPTKLLPITMGPKTQQHYPVQIPFKWTAVHLDQGLKLSSDECCMGLVH